MKRLFFIVMLLLAVGATTGFGQQQNEVSAKEQKKLDKRKDKALKNEKALKKYELYNKLVKDSTFVFMADNWTDERNTSVSIDPTINFLVVKKEKSFFQFGLDNMGPGFNGLGGASIDSRVVSYRYHKGKNSKKSSQLIMTVKSRYLQGTMTFVMTFFGESATVDVTGANGRRISLQGALFPLEKVNLMGSGSEY
jgi:hypothetical protein